ERRPPQGRRDHGHEAPQARGVRRAIPPRVHRHGARQAAARELPQHRPRQRVRRGAAAAPNRLPGGRFPSCPPQARFRGTTLVSSPVPVLCVIPARLASSRLPRKPLLPLAGEPLIVWVARRVADAGVASRVVVATDAREIAAHVERAGYEAILTTTRPESGTERVAEVVAKTEFTGFDLVLNVQGDEPLVAAAALCGAGRGHAGRRGVGRGRADTTTQGGESVSSTKYVFVTGGVVSSLGKGIAAASLGRLLVERGLRVTIQKFDPYINVDPGTMSPFQ